MATHAFLLTGEPQVGKTSIVKRVIELAKCKFEGFYTQEIRTEGERRGFELVTLTGEKRLFADVNIQSPYCVGRYGVDLQALHLTLESSTLKPASDERVIFVVDEIGPMQMLSGKFQMTISKLLEDKCMMIGTIVNRSFPFSDEIKSINGVIISEVTPDTHNDVIQDMLSFLKHGNVDDGSHTPPAPIHAQSVNSSTGQIGMVVR